MADKVSPLDLHYFGAMTEAALVGIYVIQDGLLRYVNPALACIFGYQPEELVDQIHVLDLIHPEDRQSVSERMQQRLAGQIVTTPHVARGISRSGDIIYFESLAQPINYLGSPAILGTLVDTTAYVQSQQHLEQQRRRLQRLSAQLIAVREAESKRISQELHDVIGQALTAVSINLAKIKQELSPDEPAAVWERLAEAEVMITQALIQTRNLSQELRPAMLDDLGLIPTLRWYIHHFGKRLGIPISFSFEGKLHYASPELETMIYRVVQEGLTNIARHAKASKAKVRLDCQADRIHLTIKDDGVGFDVQQLMQSEDTDDRFGLLGMEERILLFAGVVQVHSAPGKGTTLQVTFPYQQTGGQPETLELAA